MSKSQRIKFNWGNKIKYKKIKKENRNLDTKKKIIYSCLLVQFYNTKLNTTNIYLSLAMTNLKTYNKL